MAELVPGHDPIPTTEDQTPESWSTEQKSLYSRMVVAIIDNPAVFNHPDAPELQTKHWYIVAHNVSWIAAEMIDPNAKDIEFKDDETGETLAFIKVTERTLS